ncbi:hypothetical protein EV401DRAFT_2084213 [Pisolithus croceorrhizus]|nr:hypothetical protein EV401DRAFT_2084213 [Pisolithus croceorrhizus]
MSAITPTQDSIRPIIDNADKILHMLIGINKFICCKDSIAGHPWLLTVDQWSISNRQCSHIQPTTLGSATSEHAITPSSNAKGREGDKSPIAVDHPTIPALDNNVESEVEDVDELIDDEDELDELPETEAEDVDNPPTKKKRIESTAVNNASHPLASSTGQNKNQLFSIIIPTPKQASSYAIPPSHRMEASGSMLVRAVSAESQTAMPALAPTPEWLPPSSTPGIPKLLMWVNAMTDRQDLILAWVNNLKRHILGLDSCTPAPTPRLMDDWICMLETELAEFQWTVGTLTQEVEALQLKVQGAMGADVDGLMSQHIANQTEQVSSLHQDNSATASMESAAQQLQGPTIDPVEKEPEAMAATEPLVVEDAAHTCEVLVTVATPPNVILEAALTMNMEVYTSTTEEGGHSEVGNGNITLERGTDEAMVPADDHLQVNSRTSTNLDMVVDGP